MGDDQLAATQQQDNLRPLRIFVGALQQVLGSDQSYAGTDASVNNPPRQFVVVGSGGGVSVEGQPITIAGTRIPRWVVWAGLGFMAYKFLKKD